MDAAEQVKYLKENVLDKRYDCIFFVVGHSVIGGSRELYKDVHALTDYPNPTVITGLAAPPGSLCFSSAQLVMLKIKHFFYKPLSDLPDSCLYGRPPIDVLHTFVDGLKEHTPKDEDKRVKMDTFRATEPVLSTNHVQYYDRRWIFETGPKGDKRPGGFVALLYLNKHGVQFLPLYERKIGEMVVAENGEKRGFYITKTELLQDLFKNTPFRHPLFMDIGCSDYVIEKAKNPISLEEFMANGIYGGKKKKRNSYRSKKTIRITQR